MNHGTHNKDEVAFHAEVDRRQRSIIWPDTMINGSRIDGFLWKGSTDATIVQRVGAVIFGSFFGISSVVFLSFAERDRSIFLLLFSIFWLLIGWKVFANALSPRLKRICFQPVAALLVVAFVVLYLVWPLAHR